MDILIQISQFILSLSILVVLHEFGHFLPAKLFGTRVEKFYLFFDYKFSLLKKKIGETEWGIGWIPLGGYVKIAGMVDESMDKDQMNQEPQPWEFRSKPAWQRLIIILGGVTVNLILAYFIYVFMLAYYGRTYIPIESQTYGVKCDSLMLKQGFMDGDKIMAMNGEKLVSFNKIDRKLLLDDIKDITVERNGNLITLPLPADFGQEMLDNGVKTTFAIRFPTFVDSLQAGMGAEKAGIKKGDQIISVAGKNTLFFNDLVPELKKYKSQKTDIGLIRGQDTLFVNADINDKGELGFMADADIIQTETVDYTLFEAFPAGFDMAGETLSGYVISIKYLFSVSGVKNMGGLISMGSMFSTKWDWQNFWGITAFLSLVLAFMNVLPIPALDGGHAVFIIYELITGRKPSEKFLEKAQTVGMILLIGLMVYALGNDIWKFIISKFI